MPPNEWELSANIAALINQIIGKGRTLPFSKARCEHRPDSPPEKRVLTLLGGIGQILVTGEVRSPFLENGVSPFSAAFVNDARVKACKVSSRYFFTLNLKECVLWETTPNRSLCWEDQNYVSWEVTEIFGEKDMERMESSEPLKNWLRIFLGDLAKIITGVAGIPERPIDEKFVDVVKSMLRMPISLVGDEIKRKQGGSLKARTDAWARDDHRWISTDTGGKICDNVERAAHFVCWDLVKRLAAHEALLKGRGGEIDRISVPEYIDSGEALRNHIEGYFADAIGIAGDHGILFHGEDSAAANRIAFCSDLTVPYWRELIGHIRGFNFPGLEDSVIRGILKRLMSPEELDRYGWVPAEGAADVVTVLTPVRPEVSETGTGRDCEAASDPVPMQQEGLQVVDSVEEEAGEKKSKRRRIAKHEEIAAQVTEELKATYPEVFRHYDPDFLDRRKPFDTIELPAEGDPEPYRDLFKKQGVLFKKGKRQLAFIETKNPAQDDLIVEVAKAGIRGFVRFPQDEDECKRVLQLFTGFAAERLRIIRELIEKKADSGQARDKACSAVARMVADRKWNT